MGDIINLYKLLTQGFCSGKLPDHMANNLYEYVSKEKFVIDKAEGTELVSWDEDTQANIEPPEFYQKFFKLLINTSYFKPYFATHKPFTYVKYTMHKLHTGYTNPWHCHYKEAYEFDIIIHLTKDRRGYEDGGFIQCGHLNNQEDWFNKDLLDSPSSKSDDKQINMLHTGLCNNGEFEILLNGNPLFQHRVTNITSDKERISLMMACGYDDKIKIRTCNG